MNAVRKLSSFLFYPVRILSWIVILITCYVLILLMLHEIAPGTLNALKVSDDRFEIMFPFTNNVFLLGDYTSAYLISNILTITFYACFLWLLSNVFKTFSQVKLFTRSGISILSSFYISNLLFPVVFLFTLLLFGEEIMATMQVILLHLVIGVFAWFMAAIFRQGVLLQEEQDLTF